MHIAIYHDAVIPPLQYGGTERVIDWLAQSLLAMGHRVSLLAKKGSLLPGAHVIPLPEDIGNQWEVLVPSDCDLIHLFSTPAQLPRKPFLVTIGGNGKPGERYFHNTVFVSLKHAQNHSSTHFVYNGLNPNEFECELQREDYLVFLAKASWSVKNLKGAVDVARTVGLPLKVMGSRNWPFQLQRYLPAWNGIQYLGMLSDHEKRPILKKARGLLFPVVWHEPFGVAITEALVSGCPVFATPYGSIPEIVTPEVGFLSANASELAEAIRTMNFSSEKCRNRVYQGFTHQQMAEKYIYYYTQVLEKGRLSEVAPQTIPYRLPLVWHSTRAKVREKGVHL